MTGKGRQSERADARDTRAAGAGSGAPQGGALSGIRVVDLSRVLAGPYCTMMLGDAGADVIKVEAPAGDETRRWSPPAVAGQAAYYLSCNRNKRSIAVDLSRPEGQEVVRRLIAGADVVVENFKHGTMERWGLGYEEALRPLNPGLIYCSISGFGRTGPYKDLPGYDFVVQAMGGLMSITGEEGGEPVKVGVAVSDLTTGMMAAMAISMALYRRSVTGEGQRVDLSLLETQVAWLANQAYNYLVGGMIPRSRGNSHPNIVPYQALRAADRPFVVAAGNDRQYAALCRVLGAPELIDDQRFATNTARVTNRAELIPLLEERLRTRPAAEWIARLWEAGVPAGPINDVAEVFQDPQVLHRQMLTEIDHPTAGRLPQVGLPVKFGGTPGAIRRHPPLLSEHAEEILREVSYSSEEIDCLFAQGVVLRPQRGG